MRECWHHEPEYRPSFGEIIMMLEPYVCDAFRTSSFYLNQPPSAREPTEPSPTALGEKRRLQDSCGEVEDLIGGDGEEGESSVSVTGDEDGNGQMRLLLDGKNAFVA